MKAAAVIHWKTGNPPGLRCFSDSAYAQRRVVRAGGSLADLHDLDGVFVYWPPALGAFPSAETLAQWELEYDQAHEIESQCQGYLNGGGSVDERRLAKAKMISDLAFRLGKPPAQLTAQELLAERNRIAAIYKNL